jgi:hypothetical protein
MHAIKAVFKVLLMIAIPMILGNLVYYIIGSFLALDFNPLNWWAFKEPAGRIIITLFEIILLVNVPKFWEDIDFDI